MSRGIGFLIEVAAIAVIIAALANFVAPAVADFFELFGPRHPALGCARPQSVTPAIAGLSRREA